MGKAIVSDPLWTVQTIDPDQRLLDHFAGLAMQAILSTPDATHLSDKNLAADAYSVAEAMMAERKKRMEGQ